jgi:hypothetical protein
LGRAASATRQRSHRVIRRATEAGACAAVLVAFLVIGRAPHFPQFANGGKDDSGNYSVPLPAQTRQFSAPDVALRDDDRGRPMFNLPNLAPGSHVQDCITVTYTGTTPTAILALAVTATGALAPHLATTIERGAGGKFANCGGFVPHSQVFTGSLADLAAAVNPVNSAGLPLGPVKRDVATTFRFSFVVGEDGVAQGATAGADFMWSAHA